MINMGDFTPNYGNVTHTNPIEAIPLDNFDFPKIDLIKIDVQGWELKVLNGAKKLINKYKPVLIVEFETHQLQKINNSCNDLANLIREMGYYIYYLEYSYPSDHICIPNENLSDFELKFENYIYTHTNNNNINNNVLFGVNKKIKLNYTL